MEIFKKLMMVVVGVLMLLPDDVYSQDPVVTLDIVESSGGCSLSTDCASDFICFDIQMSVDQDKNLDSYNVWVQYDNTILSRVSGGDDASCVLDNGNDTDTEAAAGAYRVAGIPGAPYGMTAGETSTVHTICFSIIDPDAFDGSTINVGGTVFGVLQTTVTFDDATNDVVTELSPLVMNSNTVSCLVELPVKFLSFEALKRDHVVDLDWKTIEEINNSHFEIERSTDGLLFQKIGNVLSNGSGFEIRDYQFTDLQPKKGENYYRLKQVDVDGGFDYSEIRSAIFDEEALSYARVQVFPNPVVDEVNITLYKKQGSLSTQLLDANGRTLETQYLDKEITGTIQFGFQMSDYPAGNYLIKIIHQGDTEISQVVKVNE